jgi:uncharacterized protein with PIN domain
MARMYANENMALEVVERLRLLGHDVLLTIEAGQANQGIPDEEVLAYAHERGRILLTFNYLDFKRIHQTNPNHSGVIICKMDTNFQALADRIHEAIQIAPNPMNGELLRIVRPNIAY